MPDIAGFKLTAKADSSLTVARITVEGKFLDDVTHQPIAGLDFTGANSFDFAFRVPGWTVQQHRDFVERVAHMILRMKAGLE